LAFAEGLVEHWRWKAVKIFAGVWWPAVPDDGLAELYRLQQCVNPGVDQEIQAGWRRELEQRIRWSPGKPPEREIVPADFSPDNPAKFDNPLVSPSPRVNLKACCRTSNP
jgi:hypothetical protein